LHPISPRGTEGCWELMGQLTKVTKDKDTDGRTVFSQTPW